MLYIIGPGMHPAKRGAVTSARINKILAQLKLRSFGTSAMALLVKHSTIDHCVLIFADYLACLH
jgi:hypothetical protein